MSGQVGVQVPWSSRGQSYTIIGDTDSATKLEFAQRAQQQEAPARLAVADSTLSCSSWSPHRLVYAMLRSYRRLTQLLGGPERAAVAAASAVPPQPQSPGSAALSSQAGHATSVQDHAEEVWWDELEAVADHRGSGGSDGGRRRFGGRRTPPLDAPIDRPRTLRDYQRMMLGLSRRKRCGARLGAGALAAASATAAAACRAAQLAWPSMTRSLPCCRAYLMRDVLEEMSLNGVRPDQQILTTGAAAREGGHCQGVCRTAWLAALPTSPLPCPPPALSHTPPARHPTTATGLLACMKRRKLGDALFFFEEMKRRGIQLDVSSGQTLAACMHVWGSNRGTI